MGGTLMPRPRGLCARPPSHKAHWGSSREHHMCLQCAKRLSVAQNNTLLNYSIRALSSFSREGPTHHPEPPLGPSKGLWKKGTAIEDAQPILLRKNHTSRYVL